MKPDAYLINTSRGPLVDEAALADALERKLLRGAAVDVLSSEPPDPENPLLHAPACLVTPHIAWSRELPPAPGVRRTCDSAGAGAGHQNPRSLPP